MTRKNKTSRPRRGGAGGRSGGNPSSTALAYNGPIITQKDLEMDAPITIVSREPFDLVSTVGGVIANVIDSDPSTIQDWASLAAVYSQFRVLATMLEFYPSNKYSKTTTLTKALCHVADRSGSTPLANYGQAAAFESFQLLSLDEEFSMGSKEHPPPVIRMSSAEEAQWGDTSAPGAHWYHKLYADTVSASTTYGVCLVTFRVQFRGRR